MHGFYRVAAASPQLVVADVDANVDATIALAQTACAKHAAVTVFPELGLCGYSCGDLLQQPTLLRAVRAGVARIAEATAGSDHILVIGLPLQIGGRLYNCAAVLQGGSVRGIVPKSVLPTYREFYEKRWFRSGEQVRGASVELNGETVPFGVDLLFAANDELVIGIEICEDLWTVVPPSCGQAMAGATVLANLSASNELVAKADYRRGLVCSQSARCVAAYVYASAGPGESSTDLVFGGHCLIAENGGLAAESERFQWDSQLVTADIDCARLRMTRLQETSFDDAEVADFCRITLAAPPPIDDLRRAIDPHPFVPTDPQSRNTRCQEIFAIQATGLAKRLRHISACSAVIGISGGLDSTLALLVAHRAFALADMPLGQLITVTMPGFGTSDRTRDNAIALCQHLGTTLREISIVPACTQHFADIAHPADTHDVVFENVQARERTQLLMGIANQQGGIVIGTGDLSEVALGWSTYNGDHMSMYGVNASVPKTLVRYVIDWVAESSDPAVHDILRDILDTPISPELLPTAEDGSIAQHTESVIGPYELHDFFLYHNQKYGAPPEKILFLAQKAFADRYEICELRKWLRLFYGRFFSQQFKRSCFPDGPKVGTISLSPRGDWRMPSDASVRTWMKALDAAE
ncbi:MAG: NAD+ synthase (glutamine-hydrolyzing) [Rhodothermales bacterium]|jgi:NAD+ synthase (glutamine-hydrolysing)